MTEKSESNASSRRPVRWKKLLNQLLGGRRSLGQLVGRGRSGGVA